MNRESMQQLYGRRYGPGETSITGVSGIAAYRQLLEEKAHGASLRLYARR